VTTAFGEAGTRAVQPRMSWAARSEATMTNSNEFSEAERWIIGRSLRRP
jgi:hypothetical protein